MSETPLKFRTRVVRTEWLTPHMVRVVVGADELAQFPDNGFTDRYVKLMFPRPGAPLDFEGGAWELPPEQRPIFRTYTVRRTGPDANQLTIDFVHHGDAGLAGPWAASAQPGDELVMSNPGGAYAPDPTADVHLLVGDDAALPAIASALEMLPANARAIALLEVDGPSDELALTTEADVDLRWLHRGGRRARTDVLLDATRALDLPRGRVHTFVHGELMTTRAIKQHLLHDRQLDPALLSASGYWRRGKDEDGFQAEKRALAAQDAGGSP